MIEYFVEELKKENITYVSPWTAPAIEGDHISTLNDNSQNNYTSMSKDDVNNEHAGMQEGNYNANIYMIIDIHT